MGQTLEMMACHFIAIPYDIAEPHYVVTHASSPNPKAAHALVRA